MYKGHLHNWLAYLERLIYPSSCFITVILVMESSFRGIENKETGLLHQVQTLPSGDIPWIGHITHDTIPSLFYQIIVITRDFRLDSFTWVFIDAQTRGVFHTPRV
jgi:hypothetical protein